MSHVLRWLRTTALWSAALLILFEQWGWEPLARLLARLGRLPLFGALERALTRLPPVAALAVFLLPALALLPVKLLALYWLAAGHRWLGFGVIVAAKIIGTAVVARLFQLTQPQLMKLAWFAAIHTRWTAFRQRVIAMVRASAAWRAATRVRAQARHAWRALWGRVRRATRRSTGE